MTDVPTTDGEMRASVDFGERVVKALLPTLSGEAFQECCRIVGLHGAYRLHASLEAVSSMMRRAWVRNKPQLMEYRANGNVNINNGVHLLVDELAGEVARCADFWIYNDTTNQRIRPLVAHPDAYAIVIWIYSALAQQPLLLAHFRCELDGELRMLRYVSANDREDDSILRWHKK